MLIPAFDPVTMRILGPKAFTALGLPMTKLCDFRPERIALYITSSDWNFTLITPFPSAGTQPLSPPTPEMGLWVVTYTTFPLVCSLEWYATTIPPNSVDLLVYEIVPR